MANAIQLLYLVNNAYAQPFTGNVITPILYDFSYSSTEFEPVSSQYFSTTIAPASEVTVLQQCIAFTTLTITIGTTTTGLRTSFIQYFPYEGLGWITIAAHSVNSSASDGSAQKTTSCQVVRRFSQGDKIRTCAMTTVAGTTTLSPSQNVNTGATLPKFTIVRAVI